MARTQFTFTFTNAQPGSVVTFGGEEDHLYADATSSARLGHPLILNSSNAISVWSDATTLIATTEDGVGNNISATATAANPSVTTADGTAGQNPYGGGSSSASKTGINKRGIYVPAGGLDVWKAARDASSSQLVEVVGFGDSRLFGLCDSGPGNISIFDRLRARVISAGLTDGGKGIFAGNENLMTARDASPTEVNGLNGMPSTFTGVADQFDTTAGQYIRSSAVGETHQAQGYGNRYKIWLAQRANTGNLTVSIDSGTANPVTGTLSGTSIVQTWQQFTGLSSGLHTVNIANTGSHIQAPTGATAQWDNNTFAGTLTLGQTYYYKLTYQKAGTGETTGSTTVSAAIPGSGTARTILVQLVTTAGGGSGSNLPSGYQYGIYRSTSSSGPFQLMAYVAGGSGGTITWRDDGSLTPGATIPSSNTAGLDPALSSLYIAHDFTFNTGIVWHKHATSGALLGGWLDPMNRYLTSTGYKTSGLAQAALGLTQTQGTSGGSFSWQVAQDSTTGARRPKLAILYLGFNDMTNIPSPWSSATAYTTGNQVFYAGQFYSAVANNTNVTPGSDSTKWLPSQPQVDFASVAAQVHEFIELARAAGADPLVLAGEERLNNKALNWGGRMMETIRDVAVSNGAAFADLMEPLGAGNNWSTYSVGGGSPHISKAGKILQADWLWDNVLSPTAYS